MFSRYRANLFISGKELNNDRLTSWCAVLNEVIDKQEEREHHCLHAIQLVLEDLSHPPG